MLVITFDKYDTNNHNKNIGYDYQLLKKHSHINIFTQIINIIEKQKDNYEYFLIDITKKHENTFLSIQSNDLINKLKENNINLLFPCMNDTYKEYPPIIYDILNTNTKSIRSIIEKNKIISSKLFIGKHSEIISFLNNHKNHIDFDSLEKFMNNNYNDYAHAIDISATFFSLLDSTKILAYISNDNDIIGYMRPYTIIHFTELIPKIFESYDNKYIKNDNIAFLCINLKERKDRYDKMNILFNKLGLKNKVKFFFADRHEQGAMYGCYDSHIKAMDMGNNDIIIVFEDDSTLYDDIDISKFNNIMHQMKFYLTIGYDFFSFGCVPLPNYSTILNTDYTIQSMVHGHFITALGYGLKRDKFIQMRDNMIEYMGHIHYDMYYAISDFKKIGLAEPILYQNFNDSNNSWMPTQLSALSDIESYIRDTLAKTIKYSRKDSDLTYTDIAMIKSFSFFAYMYVKIGKHKMC